MRLHTPRLFFLPYAIAGAFALAVLGVNVRVAHACPACFGATDSPMGAGLDAGVSVLIGVIAFVLVGVAGTGLFWIHRSRRFPRPDDAPIDPST